MNSRFFFAGLILVAALAGSVFLLKKFSPLGQVAFTSLESKAKGPAGARVEIVEYSDFQCPACQKVQAVLAKILAQYPADVRLIYRHFPLPGHLWSSLAHQAAECAHRAGKFWGYHDRLYAEQSKWSTPANPAETFLQYARDLGLDLDAFGTCLADETIRKIVQDEKLRGEGLKITATPTFFINGRRIVGPVDMEKTGEAAVRRALGLAEQ